MTNHLWRSTAGRLRGAALAVAAAAALFLSSFAAQAQEVTVFAAASLQTALQQIVADYQAGGGGSVVVSYAGSAALARQIEQGAPADIFISASTDWMDKLDEAGLIRSGTRVDLLGNTLVLVAHGSDAPKVALTPELDLSGLIGSGQLAMALVDSVPAGVYGKEALTSLGLWESVAPKVAQADNVRAALALVSVGGASYGIVYGSDAAADGKVSVVGTFPAQSHAPIVFPAALTASARDGAEAFLDYLKGEKAAAVFQAEGFTVLTQ